MTQQPPPPGPGFGPPPPQYAPAPPPYAPAAPPYAPAPPPYAPAPPPYAAAPPPYGQVPPQPVPAGPDFLAVDKRNAVVVDASGVAFELSGHSLEFRWPEIRSVHYQASPNGKALMVAVIHMDGRFFECVVEAKPRSRLQEWFPQLAQVLGHYRPMG
ncbi:hypothetical protein [Streptomyces sp. NRRL S-455]|uniref:hypothetical protein n=1 Tax=Streptomyces sp. NRRL S-455 TaxID=1463908 RepID=UPI0004C061CF|nr:hypothetical protein [Streptomyces sp. NRRL S-455]